MSKQNCVELYAEGAKRAPANMKMNQLCDRTKTLAGQFKKSESPVSDKSGTVLAGANNTRQYNISGSEFCKR